MPTSTDMKPSKRIRSPIIEEEDCVLENDEDEKNTNEDTPKISIIKSKEQEHNHKVEETKLKISSFLLIGCFIIVVSCTVIDVLFKPNSNLVAAAFEFAKTIATAVIGYLFAANSKA